jgi:indole-3-glycerol phosphate synthase
LLDSSRAFATDATGPAQRRLARATSDVPLLVTAPVTTPLECQRARYFGADGVCVPAKATLDVGAALLSARSMHMTSLLAVRHDLDAANELASDARAWILSGLDLALARRAAELDRRRVLVVDASTERDVSPEALRALLGVVDAIVVPPHVHRGAGFDELAAELDG